MDSKGTVERKTIADMEMRLLPFYLWKTGAILREHEKSNYELYLTEFVNASKAFMSITGGIKVKYKKRQSEGQWDCYLNNSPFLDFKFLCSKKMQNEMSKVCRRLIYKGNGSYRVVEPKSKHKGDGYGNNYMLFFRDKTVEQLHRVNNGEETFDADPKYLEDIRSILKVVSTDKKCLFLNSDFFIPKNVVARDEVYQEILDILNKNLSGLFKYRDSVVEQETYMSCLLPRYEEIVFFRWDGCSFTLFDKVPFACSDTFTTYSNLVLQADFVGERIKNRTAE